MKEEVLDNLATAIEAVVNYPGMTWQEKQKAVEDYFKREGDDGNFEEFLGWFPSGMNE